MPFSSSPSAAAAAVAVTTSFPLDLNLVPPLKLEPKPEPPDIQPFELGPTALLEPEPLAQEPPELNAASDDANAYAILDEYIRLAHRFVAAGGDGRALVQVLPPPLQTALAPGGSSAAAAAASTKRKPRSSELSRVSSLSACELLYFRNLVRHTRITFESLRVLLMLRGSGDAKIDGRRTRAHNKAAVLMADRDLWLNRDRRIIGAIPGINVGDVFLFRIELCVLGLHGQSQAGIDYVTTDRSSNGEPIATSIVVSGGYEDDVDNGLMIIYTGHGGREFNMHRHSVDQKLAGGNLALERSMNYGIEIRVIRSVQCESSPLKKVYVYDGLYKVVDTWLDVGKSGFGVYKYKLLRIDGQEEMGSTIFRFAEELKANPNNVRPKGYLSMDMSMGREKCPILLFNDIDDDREPLLFEYVARPVYPSDILGVKKKDGDGECKGCQCISNCSAEGCSCTIRNGGEFPYNGNNILLKGKSLIYECGEWCHCPLSCPNRLSQRGLTYRFEIFRSKETGWGVRSLDLIRAGTFVCELSGVVLTKQQAENGSSDSLVHPGQLPARWVEWGDISDVEPECASAEFPLSDLSFALDVSRMRNVGCYLSHSCTPNVFAQCVLFDHHNTSYPHIMIFAMENIPPLRELSIDYGIQDELIGRLTM